jgi:hypothetical protein
LIKPVPYRRLRCSSKLGAIILPLDLNSYFITSGKRIVVSLIIRQKKEFSMKTRDTLECNITGMFNLIWLQRNEAGHPTGIKRDRDEMFANLTLFTMYCKTINDLIASFKKI